MPELNFKITGDDSELKKTLAGIAKIAKENSDKIQKEIGAGVDAEVKSREKAVKIVQKQKEISLEIVNSAQLEADATDKVTEAIKRKNAAFDANGRQIRPIQMSDSQAEIDAANASKVGSVKSGTVVGSSAELNAMANAAASYGNAAKEAFNKAVSGANNNTEAVNNAQKAIRSLKINLQAYKNIAESSTDSKRLAEYNNKVRETEAEIARLRNVGKAGFDEMGNKITSAAGRLEILNAKLKNLQEGLLKAKAPQSFVNLNRSIQETEAEIGRLKNAGRKGFDEMGNTLGKSTNKVGALWQGLKSVANILPGVGLAGLLAFAVEPIMDYIKNLDIFKKKAAEIAREAGLSSSEYKNAVSSVATLKTSIDEYHNGTITGKRLVDLYNKSIGETAGVMKTTTEVEEFYNSKAGDYIKAVLLRAQANAALETSTDLLVESQKRAINGPNLADYAKATIQSLGKALSGGGDTSWDQLKMNVELIKDKDVVDQKKKAEEMIKEFDNLKKEADEFAKANGFNFDPKTNGKGAKEAARIAEQQRSLQQKIDDINKEYARKTLTRDQEELQAVRDKFKKIADEAARFNRDPKNRLHLVDTSMLDTTRDNAINDLIYRQQTEKLKFGLDKQKALYADFEDYKTKLGVEAANDRFSKEMSTAVSYLELLKIREKEITDIAPEKRTGAQNERLEFLQKQIDVEKLAEQKKYDALVKQFVSYSDELKALEEEYQRDIARIQANGGNTSARAKAYNEKRNSLLDDSAKDLEQFKLLFKGIEELSDGSARRVIDNAEAMLKALVGEGKISKELADQITKMINSSKSALEDRMPQRLFSLANQIDAVADAVSNVDEGFGKMLHTLGNVVGQVGNVKQGIKDLKAAQGLGKNGMEDFSSIGQLTAGLGIFGAGFSILSSVSKLFDKSAQREEQAAYSRELQNKQVESINKALERQVELINDAYGTERIKRYDAALAQAKADEVKYQQMLEGRYSKTGNKFVDDIFERANAGDKNALGGIKNLNDLNAFKLPSDLKELQRLLEEGKLDAGTAVIVSNLIAATEQAQELRNNLSAELVGSSLDSIADSFVDALTDGTKDFGKTFEDIIKTSILNGFKGDLIAKSLQPFYDTYAELSKDGLTEKEIEQLTKLKDQIIADGEKQLAELEKVTGVDLTTPSKKGGLESSGIMASQESVDVNNAIARSNYEQLKNLNLTAVDMLNVAMRNLDAALETAANTFRTANNTDDLGAKLDQIITNTKPGPKSQGWQAVGG